MRAVRRLTKSRQTKRIDYGNEHDWLDLLAPWFDANRFMLGEAEIEKHRRSQFAYLARYAPGARLTEHVSLYELKEWVIEISAIVKEESKKAESGDS